MSASKLVVQTKAEYPMLAPEAVDGLRATVGVVRSFDKSESVKFSHLFSGDGSMRAISVEKLG
jgi:hypothetical protein